MVIDDSPDNIMDLFNRILNSPVIQLQIKDTFVKLTKTDDSLICIPPPVMIAFDDLIKEIVQIVLQNEPVTIDKSDLGKAYFKQSLTDFACEISQVGTTTLRIPTQFMYYADELKIALNNIKDKQFTLGRKDFANVIGSFINVVTQVTMLELNGIENHQVVLTPQNAPEKAQVNLIQYITGKYRAMSARVLH